MKNTFAQAIAAHRNEILPQLCGSDLAATDALGRTLLHQAASAANVEAVEYLCAAGADVNAPDNDRNTALHLCAAAGGQAAAALLAAGADPYGCNIWGATPLMHALCEGRFLSLRPLLAAYAERGVSLADDEDKDGVHVLLHAVRALMSDELRSVLALGGRVSACDEEGNTALLIAAGSGWATDVRELLAAGADPNDCNQNEETALHLAVRVNSAEKVALLLAAGARPNVEDAGGHTPLSIAISHARFRNAVQLIEAGADVSVRFPIAQLNTLYNETAFKKSGCFDGMRRATMEKLMQLIRDFLTAHRELGCRRGEERGDYLLLAVLYGNPTLARLLVQRCPALLPPELEEAYYHFISATEITD